VPGLVFKIGELRISVLDAVRPTSVPANTSVLVVPPGLELPEGTEPTVFRTGRSMRARGARPPVVVIPESTKDNLQTVTAAVNPVTGETPLVNLMTVNPAGVDVETVTP
jgi:hypothetical protein